MQSLITDKCCFQLYVVGSSLKTRAAIANIRRYCEENFQDGFELEVIDIFEQPELAEQENILAAPTLVRSQPLPKRRIVGDMSDTGKVVAMLSR